MCEVSAVGWISDYQPEGPGFNPRPGSRVELRATFTTPAPRVDRDVKPLVQSISRRSVGGLFKKEPTYLSIRVG